MTAPRLCPECQRRQLGRYDSRCIECEAKWWLGLTHLPRSHSPTVLDPEGRDVIAEDVAAIDAALSFPEDASKE